MEKLDPITAPNRLLAWPGWRDSRSFIWEAAFQVGALALAIAVALGIVAALGQSPVDAAHAVWDGALGSRYAFQTSLGYALPTVLVAGGVWVAYSAGLFNIGGEGQLQWGALVAVLVGLEVKDFPTTIGLLLTLGAGAIAGALWAGIPIVLKVARGSSELISGIMLNFVAILLVNYLVNGPVRDPNNFAAITRDVPPPVRLSVYVAFGIACAIVLILRLAVGVTRVGLITRAIGANREAAFRAGLPISRIWIAVFFLSGAIVGLGGAAEILSVQHSVSQNWSLNWGLLGIAVAFLAVREPLLIIGWGMLFGIMQAAGPTLKASTSIPDAIVTFILMMPVVMYFALRAIGRALDRSNLGGGDLAVPGEARLEESHGL